MKFHRQETAKLFSALLYKKSALKEAVKEMGTYPEFTVMDNRNYTLEYFFENGRAFDCYKKNGNVYYKLPVKYLPYATAVIVEDAYGFSLYHFSFGCSLNEVDHRTKLEDARVFLEQNGYTVILPQTDFMIDRHIAEKYAASVVLLPSEKDAVRKMFASPALIEHYEIEGLTWCIDSVIENR